MSTTPEPTPGSQTTVPAGRYQVDTARSEVKFRAKAFGLIWVNGRLPVARGDINVNGETIQGTGELAADGVDTGVGARDWHLRSSHYLRTADHPRIQVELGAVSTGNPEPSCTVTVRGRTHPVPVRVSRLERDGDALRVGLSTDLDRTPFPMLPPAAGVSRVVHLEVDLVATPAR